MTRAIYIAGPMRGRPEHNFPAFHAAKATFYRLGWEEVVSPVDIGAALFNNDPTVPGGRYLCADVRALTVCDAIALLPDWEQSTGARCEVAVALTIGLEFFDANTGLPRRPPQRVIVNGGYDRPAGHVDSLDNLLVESTEWADRTFPAASQSSRAEHLRREAVELCANPNDASEMADVAMLLGHLASHARVDLAYAVREKLARNRKRVWGKPDALGVVEHLAEGAE